MRDSVAATLVRALRARGVRRMFGIPGGGSSLDLIEAGAEQGVDFVLTRSETAAAIMAATTAELSGAPGVVLTGLGPGAAAVTNGLAHASLDRAPLVLITDAYPPATKRFASHQQIDHAALFAPLVKASCTPTGQTAPDALAWLLDAALAPPQGPVHIDLSSQAAAEAMAAPMDLEARVETAPARGAWQASEARALLARSERPALLVGVEARRAATAARALAADLAGPVLTTWKAKGVVADDDPHFVGLFAGGEAEAECVAEADLIVQLGFDPVELIPQRWRYRAPILDLGTVAKAHYGEPAARVIGPLDEAADALIGVARRQGWRPGELDRFRERITARHAMPASTTAIGPQQVVAAVAAAAPPGTRACIDAGAHMFPAMAFWPAREPHAVLISNGLATMGFALPAAIASALHEPSRPVVAFTGDAGLAMVIGELATAAEQGCALVVVAFNDAALSLIALKQHGRGLAARGSRSRAVDFAAAARAFGSAAWRIDRADALRPALVDAFGSGGPALIDVDVDPQGYPELVRSLRG